jgi:retron-type reverse transcriptase
MEDLALWSPEKGAPQGAVSPLLSNLYLHSVDVAMAGAGFLMVRYADDFVITLDHQTASAFEIDGGKRGSAA